MHHILFQTRFFLLALGSLCAAACSLSPQAPAATEIPLQSVSLYYHRGSSTGASFEQFKLSGDRLFFECGSVSGGRHAAKEQKIITISPEQLERIKIDAWQVRRYVEDLQAKFKPPGSSGTIFDPGKLSVALQFSDGPHKLETSFDSVATGTEGKAAIVRTLAQDLRKAAGDNLCGRATFYGFSGRL